MTHVAWLPLFGHFLSLSLLAIGGAITTTPEMHRYLVTEQHWMTHAQFNDSLAIAQAAPGPNVTFVALIGWHLGTTEAARMGTTNWPLGLFGAAICLIGILAPSTVLACVAARWAQKYRERLEVRAFKAGMAPIVIGLLASTAWVMVNNHEPVQPEINLRLGLITAITIGVTLRSRLHMLWLLAAGAIIGGLGWL